MKAKKQNNLFDQSILKKFTQPFIGIDEVGRGCLAGPVCAGVVILNEDNPYDHFYDSKTLSEEKRTILAQDIVEHHYHAVGWASVEEVDKINIRQATFLAMTRALQLFESKYAKQIKLESATILIDGRDIIPNIKSYKQLAIVKGDQHMRCISAASILAKVSRDTLMSELAKEYPAYGFEKHKGYGTEAHRKAIESAKPCIHHRKTFGGVKEYIIL
ncbi:MAG: ribonuclease HII [Pseudobdellovibrio sp.]